MIKKLLKIASIILLSALIAIFIFLAYSYIFEWRPKEIENINYKGYKAEKTDKERIKIVSWNIGYGGLDSAMDFYMDGGEKCNTPEHKYRKNIDKIIEFLKSNSDADFILLQEVDSLSRRSYYDPQLKRIADSLPQFKPYYAKNFDVAFVPQPLIDPIGAVSSGLLSLSKFGAEKAVRISYPDFKKFPVKMFYLKRALLELEIILNSGKKLSIFNTHNSAFDDGNARVKEIDFLRSILQHRQQYIVAGDWNSTPPDYKQSLAEKTDKFFSPVPLKREDLGKRSRFAVDYNSKTARYNNEPYKKGVTTTTLIDFAVYSDNITLLECETVDLDFENSDHNPIIYYFEIENQ